MHLHHHSKMTQLEKLVEKVRIVFICMHHHSKMIQLEQLVEKVHIIFLHHLTTTSTSVVVASVETLQM
jgi:hypothetical protein